MSFKRSKHLTLKNYIIWHYKEAKRIRAQLPVKTAIAFPKLLYIHIAINLSAAKLGKRLEHRLWLVELAGPLPCQQQQHKHGTNLHQPLSVIFSSTSSMIQQRNEKKTWRVICSLVISILYARSEHFSFVSRQYSCKLASSI